MMPPPMHGGPAGQMGYPGKIGGHPNMMNNPTMGSQPYNNQYPSQGKLPVFCVQNKLEIQTAYMILHMYTCSQRVSVCSP